MWFTYAVQTTLAKYRSKKRFYLKFSLIFAGWIVSTPMAFIMVYGGIEYYRQQRMFITEHVLLTAGTRARAHSAC